MKKDEMYEAFVEIQKRRGKSILDTLLNNELEQYEESGTVVYRDGELSNFRVIVDETPKFSSRPDTGVYWEMKKFYINGRQVNKEEYDNQRKNSQKSNCTD